MQHATSGPRRIVFTNRKGGCGKTTTSVNVAAALAHMGRRVLLIDADPQAHATMSLDISQRSVRADLATVAVGRADARDAVLSTYVPRLGVVPATRRLADFERRFGSSVEARFWFRDRLGPLMDEWDITIIDTPPTVQLLTVASLCAAREAYIPTQAHFLAMEGLLEIIALVNQVQRHHNPDLFVAGVIPTMVDGREGEEVIAAITERVGADRVLPPVRYSSKIAEAPARGHTIFQHDLRGPGAVDYYRVASAIRVGPRPAARS